MVDDMKVQFRQLEADAARMRETHLRALFAEDPGRAERFSAEACGLFVDYSKNRIDVPSWNRLLHLVEKADVAGWRDKMFAGFKVNQSEGRAALHVALRRQHDLPFPSTAGRGVDDVMPAVRAVLSRMARFSASVRSGSWRGFRDTPISNVVNIGIGGCDLGPLMICDALRDHADARIPTHFVSNIDATHLARTLDELDPATTLFLVASKSFNTRETLTNARTARQWIVDAGGVEAIDKHFVAVSANPDRAISFGISEANVFPFWDWVGGRYSIWSAVGLPVAIGLGFSRLEALHRGAANMDAHFREAPLEANLPVILGTLHVWYREAFGAQTRAVFPYDFALRHFPSYLQQLEMESLGKQVSRDGQAVIGGTSPIIWGGPGSNGQHAYYQLLHQGTQLVPADFLLPVRTQRSSEGHDKAVIANALAQMEALMLGLTEDDARVAHSDSMSPETLDALLPHLVMEGNQPTTAIVYDALDAETLGALIALYEHKVFVQSVLWDVNPFDQFGVELGKLLATRIEAELSEEGEVRQHDSSTAALIARLRR